MSTRVMEFWTATYAPPFTPQLQNVQSRKTQPGCSKRALLKEQLRAIEMEQLRREREIELQLGAKQREFDEALRRIDERRRELREDTALKLRQLDCNSACIVPPKRRLSYSTPANQEAGLFPQPRNAATSAYEPPSSPQLPPGNGLRGRADGAKNQYPRNELLLFKSILQNPYFDTSGHMSSNFPGHSNVDRTLHLRRQLLVTQSKGLLPLPSSVQHVFETLRTSYKSSTSLWWYRQRFIHTHTLKQIQQQTLTKLDIPARFLIYHRNEIKQNKKQSRSSRSNVRPTSMWRVFEALPAPCSIERTQLVKAEHHNSSAMTERLRKHNRPNTATPMNEHQVTNPIHLNMDLVVFVDTGQSRLVRISCHRIQLKRTIVVRSNNRNKHWPLPLLPTADQHAGDKTHQQQCTILLVSLPGLVRCCRGWICWISAGNRYDRDFPEISNLGCFGRLEGL